MLGVHNTVLLISTASLDSRHYRLTPIITSIFYLYLQVKDLHHIRDCVESYKPSQEQPLVQLVYGPPGIIK